MGDWEEFCESKGMNVGSSNDYDRFTDSLEKRPKRPKQEEMVFADFKQASDWSKKNGGAAFTRTNDGMFFTPTNNYTKIALSRSSIEISITYKDPISEKYVDGNFILSYDEIPALPDNGDCEPSNIDNILREVDSLQKIELADSWLSGVEEYERAFNLMKGKSNPANTAKFYIDADGRFGSATS